MDVIEKTLQEYGAKKSFFFRKYEFMHAGFQYRLNYAQAQMVFDAEIAVYCSPFFNFQISHNQWGFNFGRLKAVGACGFKDGLKVLADDENRAVQYFSDPRKRDAIEAYMSEGQGTHQELRSLLGIRSFTRSIAFKKNRIATKEIILDDGSFGPVLKKHVELLAQIAGTFGPHDETRR